MIGTGAGASWPLPPFRSDAGGRADARAPLASTYCKASSRSLILNWVSWRLAARDLA